jgi:hypothetical protein
MKSTGTPDWSTRALWQSYQQSQLVLKQEELAKEMMNFDLRPTVLLPLRKKACCGFLSPLKSTSVCRVVVAGWAVLVAAAVTVVAVAAVVAVAVVAAARLVVLVVVHLKTISVAQKT